MCSAGSKAPANSPRHRKFWSFFHLKWKQKKHMQWNQFCSFSCLSMAKEPLSSGFKFRKVLSKQNLYQLPLEPDATKNKTENPLQGHSCFLGALQRGSRSKDHRLVSSTLGTLQGHPAPCCLGNSAYKYSDPGIIPLKDLPILSAEEKIV